MITLEFLRHFRFAGYAIFDLAVSFLGIYLLSPLLSKLFLKIKIRVPKISWLYLTLPLSILIHLLVGKMTLMTKNFIDLQSNYLLKTIVIILFVFGLKDIKINRK